MARNLPRLMLCACLCCFIRPGLSSATQSDQASRSPVFSFDIGAQSVASALELYSAVSGVQVVYDGALVLGRMSRPIRGVMSSDQALDHLLDGTGLGAVYGAPGLSTLVPKARQRSGMELSLDNYMPYLGIVQGAVEDAFCRQAAIAPGAYRARLRFRIGSGGRVVSPELLDFEGDAAREPAMLTALRDIAFDRAPPADMPQPVVMEISRRLPRETGDCGGWRGRGAKLQKAGSP
jgi:hypothetical protein